VCTYISVDDTNGKLHTEYKDIYPQTYYTQPILLKWAIIIRCKETLTWDVDSFAYKNITQDMIHTRLPFVRTWLVVRVFFITCKVRFHISRLAISISFPISSVKVSSEQIYFIQWVYIICIWDGSYPWRLVIARRKLFFSISFNSKPCSERWFLV